MTTALLDRLSAPAPATPAALPRHYLLTRFRALALFGCRPAERVVRSVLPASENLHNSRLLHCSKTSAELLRGDQHRAERGHQTLRECGRSGSAARCQELHSVVLRARLIRRPCSWIGAWNSLWLPCTLAEC